jgi:polyisoprenoid-binding protein YceI
VKHLGVTNVTGSFGKTTGTATWDGKDISTISVQAVIDASTITTHNEQRDGHLKSPDFFDVAKYPTIEFKSKKAQPAAQGHFLLTGDLTMHGVTKEVVLEVEGPSQEIKDPQGKARIAASATAKINRKDFGLAWNKLLDGGVALVGEDVSLTIDVELVKKT